MKDSMVWMSLGGMLICLYLSFGLWQEGRERYRQFNEESRQIVIARLNIDRLSSLQERPIFGIEQSYEELYGFLNNQARFLEAGFLAELAKAKDEGKVSDAILPSSLEGVEQLPLKISFSPLEAPDGFIRVLKGLDYLQRSLPAEIRSINGLDKGIEMMVDIYGQSRRV